MKSRWILASIMLTLLNSPIASAVDVLRLRSAGGELEFNTNGDSAELQSLTQAFYASKSPFEAKQAQFCARSKRLGCPIFGSPLSASGFFLDNPGILVTSYHLLHAQIANGYQNLNSTNDPREALLDLQKVPLFLVGFYSTGQQALSTVESPDSVRIRAMNPSPYFMTNTSTSELFNENLFGELSDVVFLRVQHQQSDPFTGFFQSLTSLKVSNRQIKAGDVLIAYGYPVNRNGVAAIVPSRVSGQVISADQFTKRLKITESADITALRRTFLIYMEGNCPEGMSGGPILNDQGEVVGVIGGHYDIAKTQQHICYGINLQRFNQLIAEWESVNNRTLDQTTPAKHRSKGR